MGSVELARTKIVLARRATDHRTPRHHAARSQVGVGQYRLELGDQHRWRRRHVVRVKHPQQALGEAWKLGVELELHTRGEESGALEQALDVGIVNLDALHPKSPGDLGKCLGELSAHLT